MCSRVSHPLRRLRHPKLLPCGAAVLAGEETEGAHRLRQKPEEPCYVCIDGNRHRFASAHGAVQQRQRRPMVHMPFKSPGEALVSMMGGETQALFMTTTQALPLIKAGKIRALAYDYSTRASFLPNVPTMTEAGSAPTDLDSGWHGLLAPANTPAPIIKWLETEVRKALATPKIKERLTNLGVTPVGSTCDGVSENSRQGRQGHGQRHTRRRHQAPMTARRFIPCAENAKCSCE